MKSVFFRRLLVVLVALMLIASVFMVGGYSFFSRNTYTSIKLDEMKPKAQAVRQLVIEYRDGEMTHAAFSRMAKKLMEAANANVLVVSADGSVLHYDADVLQISGDELIASLEDQIMTVLSGQELSAEGLTVGDHKDMIAVGVPIDDGVGNVIGGVLIVKSTQDIIDATTKLSASLVWTTTVVIPLMLLIMLLRIKRITDPLHEMSEAAIEMSKGNFDKRVDDDQVGEVGVLARALNNLCETLSQTIYQLRSEKGQLDQILQSLSDGVAATDSLGTLTHFNPTLMRMFGAVNVNKREELISDPMIWRAFDEVFESGTAQTITYPMVNERTLWITISPVKTSGGRRTGVVGLFKDMTDMERLEAMRSEYVANVSHELRTPLTAVRGLLEPLSDGMVTKEEDRQRYYKIMLHEVMRLSRLITDMMMLSRLQSGTEYMELTAVDMDELLQDVISSYSATAKQKGIELSLQASNIPVALTDPDRVEQVLIILLDNAMRYTPQGGSITIIVRDGERLLVSVEDTGCGIPEDDVSHIFERFYKVDKSRNEGGTGLGLSIAEYIIDKLGEHITVDSEVGKGTRFTFTLKKYVSNAIALGPAGDPVMFDEIAEEAHAPVETGKGDNVVDAPYEVIEGKKRDKQIIKTIKKVSK